MKASSKNPAHKITFLLLGLAIVLGATYTMRQFLLVSENSSAQKSLDAFYTPKSNLDKPLGTVLKYEKLNVSTPFLKNAYRFLYVTEGINAEKRISSGMVFIPEGDAPQKGRPVLAWAHGTLGMGSACAPSRSAEPLKDMQWLSDALQKGWVVVATDYAGLGTPGDLYYLVGRAESNDVLNSVRAAKNIPGSFANNTFVLFGHSQGGHSVLWSAQLANSYVPELSLSAVAAAAPAAELPALISEQYDEPITWGIGPELIVSWPLVDPSLQISEVLSKSALSSYRSIAQECLLGDINDIKFHVLLKQKFFEVNPITVLSWKTVLNEQKAPYVTSAPVLVAQGLSDTVVLPNTTSLYAKKACENGSDLTMLWMKDVGHVSAANTSGSDVISWLNHRLQKQESSNTCSKPLPIAPAKEYVVN